MSENEKIWKVVELASGSRGQERSFPLISACSKEKGWPKLVLRGKRAAVTDNDGGGGVGGVHRVAEAVHKVIQRDLGRLLAQ